MAPPASKVKSSWTFASMAKGHSVLDIDRVKIGTEDEFEAFLPLTDGTMREKSGT